MSVTKGFSIVISSALAFGVIGAVLGFTLGVMAPGYYRAVFRSGEAPNFHPPSVGFGLGFTQGIVAGLLVGVAVVFAVAWYQSRVNQRDEIPTAS